MTSSEFDHDEAEMAVNGDSKKQDNQQPVNEKDKETQDDDPYGYGDVSSMYMIISLIQSNRHYYSFTSDDTASAILTLSNNISSKDQTNISQAYSSYNNSYNTRKTPSEDNSGSSSCWTPSSSCNDLKENNEKNIDNENMSDGLSIISKSRQSLSGSISSSDCGSSPYSSRP